MPVRLSWAVAVGWLVLASVVFAAEVPGNRISNGEFDDLTTDPWVELFPLISEFQVDTLFEADGCDNSKAARGINTNPKDDGATVFAICTNDVTAGELVRLTGRILFPNGVAPAIASFALTPFTETNCISALAGVATSSASSANGTATWYEVGLFEPFELPAGTQSVRVALFQIKTLGADLVTDVVFDAVRLTSANQVFVDDFEIGETCRWSAVAP